MWTSWSQTCQQCEVGLSGSASALFGLRGGAGLSDAGGTDLDQRSDHCLSGCENLFSPSWGAFEDWGWRLLGFGGNEDLDQELWGYRKAAEHSGSHPGKTGCWRSLQPG